VLRRLVIVDFQTSVTPPSHSPLMNTTSTFVHLGFVSLAALAGCGGAVDETASDITTRDGGTSSSASTSDTSASFPSFTAEQVATAQAACGQPDSAVDTYDSASKLQSLLQGNWFYCGPYGTQYDAMPVGAAGMQFTSDKEFRWLVVDSSGVLTSAVSPVSIDSPSFTFIPSTSVPAGESAEGARIGYSFLPFTGVAVNNSDGQINVQYANGDTMSTRATFESSPRRMYLEYWDNAFVYVGP
jgi:hypothetical protein